MIDKDQARLAREQKREEKKAALRKNKLLFTRAAILCVLGGLLLRVGYIKKAYGEDYERKAMAKQIARTTERSIIPNRGGILDNNKQSLAVSTTVYNVVLDIRVLVTHKESVQNAAIVSLNEALGIPMETLRGYLAVTKETDKDTGEEITKPVIDRNYYIIEYGISKEKSEELKALKIPCVYLDEDTKRTYPLNHIAAPVIGFMRDVHWGLERQYNTEMRGEAGRIFRLYDEELNAVDKQMPAKEGSTIVTNLDLTLQQYAEDAVLKAAENYNPLNAALIMMNPQTGAILAMAQYPSFNANEPNNLDYLTSKRLKEEWSELTESEQINKLYSVWSNYNITSTYEPGSIFKPVVVAAALEENIISPGSTYYCGASTVVAGTSQSIPCWYEWGHGEQNLNEVLANSCNVGMIHIIQELGRDKFYKYRNDFGFGEKTGIDLPGEEHSGSPAVMYTLSQLNPVELATSSMGQGFNCTPIQAITAFSAVINGGNLMKPYLVSQVMDKNGNIVKEYSPTIQKKVISKETSDYLRMAMVDVVSPSGTAKKGYIEGYSIGGKTGTGQQGIRDENKNTYSYIAYLPAENPEVIALALINKPENTELESSATVVPMLTEVLTKVIQYKGIQPSNSTLKEASDTAKNVITLDDYSNLQVVDITKSLNRLGLDYDFIGNGSVVGSQFPAPGSEVTSNSHIFLYLTDGDLSEELLYVPNVKGLAESQAVELLQNAGFLVVITGNEDSGAEEEAGEEAGEEIETEEEAGDAPQLPEKTVYAQMPGTMARVPRGTQIKIKVSD